MYTRFKERFGTAGVALGVIALILALGGTALAASGALTGKQKKEVEKIAKKYAGKPGAPGAPGTNGTNGKDGTNGTNGAPGKDGESVTLAAAGSCANGGTKVSVGAVSKEICNGAPGSPGDSGESVVNVGEGPTLCSGKGGVEYELNNQVTEVCNGKEGKDGKDGSPWTAGGVLPYAQSEYGSWAVSGSESDTAGVVAAIPFFIPLPVHELHAADVHYAGEETGFFTHCGSSAEEPQAEPGQLCVYTNSFDDFSHLTYIGVENAAFREPGAASTGAVLHYGTPTGAVQVSGTYVVRAPCAPGEEVIDEGSGVFHGPWHCQPEA